MSNSLDDLINKLKQLQQNAEQISGDNEVPFDELFNEPFMQQHTNNSYSSFSEFLNSSKFGDIPFEEIPDDEWDDWVDKNTDFQSWKDMQTTASQEWISKKLGF